jgi:hypothetical protein
MTLTYTPTVLSGCVPLWSDDPSDPQGEYLSNMTLARLDDGTLRVTVARWDAVANAYADNRHVVIPAETAHQLMAAITPPCGEWRQGAETEARQHG